MSAQDEPIFPNNIVMMVAERLRQLGPDVTIYRRPLQYTDDNISVGIYADEWEPVGGSLEIMGRIPGEPTLQRYTIRIDVGITTGDEEEGLALSSVISSRVRAMVYRDRTLAVVLPQLQASVFGSTERAKKWGVRRQKFISGERQGTFYFMSVLETYFETETV